jgi:hypothetical protein
MIGDLISNGRERFIYEFILINFNLLRFVDIRGTREIHIIDRINGFTSKNILNELIFQPDFTFKLIEIIVSREKFQKSVSRNSISPFRAF